MSELPQKIVVEVISSADVKRLEERDEDICKEITRVREELIGLRRTVYELMEVLGNKRAKR